MLLTVLGRRFCGFMALRLGLSRFRVFLGCWACCFGLFGRRWALLHRAFELGLGLGLGFSVCCLGFSHVA